MNNLFENVGCLCFLFKRKPNAFHGFQTETEIERER
jgi:hypothetical protein